MTDRPRSRPPLRWVALLCLVVGLLVPASSANADPTQAECDARANDTPAKLIECVQTPALQAHMQAFWDIAQANPGPDGHASRNSGEPGYKASADYVAQKMEAAGYNVTEQKYQFPYSAFVGTPSFTESGAATQDFKIVEEWNPGAHDGNIEGDLQPAGGIVIPPDPNGSTSTSGCTPADFSGFTAGHVALIQRGGCNFGVKVQNASDAGAVGVVIFNEGNPGRTGPTNGSLVDADGNPITTQIPVAFTSFAIGSTLLTQYNDAVKNGTAVPHIAIKVQTINDPARDDWNVIAESKGGDPNHVLVVDAHLDAIFGAGMLDNASGSATILDIAEQMKNVNPRNKLRFIWFGGEELGLLGSKFYVNNLSKPELNHIGYDLDADVTATPNYIIGVLDPAAPDFFSRTVPATFPNRVYKASTVARDQAVAYLDSIGKNHEFLSPNGTDAISFNNVGIPASGVLTGQDCCKSQDEVNLFGGQTGNLEGNLGTTDGGCVDNPFRWCDNLDNNDFNVMTFMSRDFANMVANMAFDKQIMSASGNYKAGGAKGNGGGSRGRPAA